MKTQDQNATNCRIHIETMIDSRTTWTLQWKCIFIVIDGYSYLEMFLNTTSFFHNGNSLVSIFNSEFSNSIEIIRLYKKFNSYRYKSVALIKYHSNPETFILLT